jgi:hypothetical protein
MDHLSLVLFPSRCLSILRLSILRLSFLRLSILRLSITVFHSLSIPPSFITCSLLGMSFFTNLPGLIPAGVSILFHKMARQGVNNKQALILDEMRGACDGALLGAIVSLDSRLHEQATYMSLPCFYSSTVWIENCRCPRWCSGEP